MSESLQAIETLIKTGQKSEARQKLKTILRDDPSADAWYLTALAVDDESHKVKCLREALKLDEFHSPANRLLYKIEGGMPQAEREKRKRHEEELKKKEIVPLEKIEREIKKDRFQKHRERQKQRSRMGCLFGLMLSVSCSMFSFSAIGMLPGFIGTVSGFLGGPPAVYDIEGTPIDEVRDAVEIVPASQVKPATDQEVDIMDHGFLHEYEFSVRRGKSYAVYVQFMSLNANAVSKNVVIVNESDESVMDTCERENILEGDLGVAYICKASSSGDWAVRILGVTGESIGAYFVGVQAMQF